MARLHMNLWDFYELTPIEVDYALKAYNQSLEDLARVDWERTRLSIYFNYLLTPSRKRKLSYESFKRSYIKLSFDDNNEEETNVIDDESFAKIQNIFQNLKGNQK